MEQQSTGSKKKVKTEKEEPSKSSKKIKLEKRQSCKSGKSKGIAAMPKKSLAKPDKTPKSPLPGPSGLQPLLIDDSDDMFGEFTGDDVPEQDLCCVCKKCSPAALMELDYIEFVKWAECTIEGCGHWVHLKYCTPVRFLRRHDEFVCPCHNTM